MSGEPIKTRFAPSPTGAMHLGNARTALFSYLLARKLGGTFLLRIEDTDTARNSEAYSKAILDDLAWLGLAWDEGPECDGGHGPYRQSERGAIYEELYRRLAEQGLTYPCFCSPEVLAMQRKTQLAAGRPPRYAGTCANLTDAEVREKQTQGLTPTLRFRVPPGRTLESEDMVHGGQRFATDDIGDFIIRRADGSAAFFFCNAIDDALMNVTHVLRGEDHLTNTPRQLLLLEALGFDAPAYGHVSLIVGRDGAPLSKRHGSASVEDLRARGLLPAAVNNTLARLGHYYESPRYMTLEQLASGFDTRHLGTASAHFDEKQLQHWQREAVLHADAATLWQWFGADVQALVPAAERETFVRAIRGNVLAPQDGSEWSHILYADDFPPAVEADAAIAQTEQTFFAGAVQAVDECGADYGAFIERLKTLTPLRGKALFQPLRAVLTGRLDGPELASLFPLLGKERIRRRLERHLC
ncbi:MAG: glutamate--tRNA ligase [Chromatiales bacterium]